jgi:Reverse transcriptase (RNA-dependent DNA polymerase)
MIVTKKTFSHPKNYRGEKCLPIHVVHKTKLRSDGKVDKVKVRAAIRGDLDMSGPKDEDNSASLATFCTLKVFLAEAARRQRHVYQADYVGAYLQAKMDHVIYVTLPAALAEVFPDLAEWFGVPLLLEKAAYGIHAAGRLWAEEQFSWYIEYEFTQSTVDPSLFYFNKGKDWIVLLSYCDDTAYFASSDEVRKRFETAMCKRFECKLMNQMHWFLQARITQHANFDITIDQSRYAVSMCSRFLPNHELVSPSVKDWNMYLATLTANTVFTKKDCCSDSSEYKRLVDEFGFEYLVAIGCLLWILNTCPRLQFSIRKLATFTQSPGRLHFKAVLHLLHHIRCHHNAGFQYYSDVFDAPVSRLLFDEEIDPSESPFYVFADSSWQDCPNTLVGVLVDTIFLCKVVSLIRQ